MSDVNVNIRGRDDGLGKELDTLRQKAVELGRDLSELNNFEEKTPTEKKVAIGKLSQNTLREQQQKIRDEYESIRISNSEYYNRQKENLSPGAFEKFEKEYRFEQGELNEQENQELLMVEREMNKTLKDIHKEMTTESKIEREKAQRDREEFREGGGIQGRLLAENRELRKQQYLSEDEEEISRLQSKIDENNKEINSYKSGQTPQGGYQGINELLMSAGSAGSGDLMGTVQGGLSGVGKMAGKFAKGLSIAGIIALILKETVGFGEKLRESTAPISAMRGGFSTGALASRNMRASGSNFSMDSDYDLGALGIKNEEQAQMMYQKAMSSGMSGDNLFQRTFEDTAFQKGFGADSSIFSEFERFTKNQETSTTIALDVLNVLTSIDESSLKEDDLTTLTEKLDTQRSILSFQRQKRDLVDNDDALKLLAILEGAGLSDKGEKASGFTGNLLQGLGEGGSDTEMMLKIEAAKRANPELLNDPLALRKKVMFNADDPEYMQEFFKMIKEISGGNKMASFDIFKTMFGLESEKDLEIFENLMSGGDASELLDVKTLKSRKSTLNKETMLSDAESGVGQLTQLLADFSNRSQTVVDSFSEILRKLIMGDAVNVNILKDKTKNNSNNPTINGPSIKTGK